MTASTYDACACIADASVNILCVCSTHAYTHLAPPQQGTADSLQLERGTDDERRADFVASLLGLRKVGWIFTQSVQERECIMSTEEVCQIAAMQDELGEQAVTAVVSMVASEDGAPEKRCLCRTVSQPLDAKSEREQ